ncbi:MAG: ATP-binding protein [Coriobacteriia bacterium]
MAQDRITLTVPSRPEYAKTVRMTAAAIVSRTNLPYDEVDDVRIAAEELFVYACDHSPHEGEVEIEFLIDETNVQIRATLGDAARVADEDAERRAAYATFILGAVCDHFEMSTDERGTHLTVVKNLPQDQGVTELNDGEG